MVEDTHNGIVKAPAGREETFGVKLHVLLLLISEFEVLDDVSEAALELKKNLPNSRILTWPSGVGISDALIGRALLFLAVAMNL